MPKILAQFEYVEAKSDKSDRRLYLGTDGVVETRFTTTGDLYRFCVKEYGRCIGACYQDKPNGGARRIGWVFCKRMKYTDVDEYYLQETWVTIHTAMPERKTTWHYATI